MEASPTASCYYLRSSQTQTCRQATVTRPGVRLATSPTKGTVTSIGSRRDIARERFKGAENSSTRAGRPNCTERRTEISLEGIVVPVGVPTKCHNLLHQPQLHVWPSQTIT